MHTPEEFAEYITNGQPVMKQLLKEITPDQARTLVNASRPVLNVSQSLRCV